MFGEPEIYKGYRGWFQTTAELPALNQGVAKYLSWSWLTYRTLPIYHRLSEASVYGKMTLSKDLEMIQRSVEPSIIDDPWFPSVGNSKHYRAYLQAACQSVPMRSHSIPSRY